MKCAVGATCGAVQAVLKSDTALRRFKNSVDAKSLGRV